MPEQGMSVAVVAAWVNEMLAEYAGRYEVLDHLFIRGAVRVVTVRRDAFFDIPRERWADAADGASHETIGRELRDWARRVMPMAIEPVR